MSDGVADVFHPLDAARLTIEHVDIAWRLTPWRKDLKPSDPLMISPQCWLR